MSRTGKLRQSRSPRPQHDGEYDYEVALRLSAELNGDQLPLSSTSKTASDLVYDADSDFEYALQLQFPGPNEASGGKGKGASSHDRHARQGGTARSDIPPWALREPEDEVASYNAETPGGKNFTTL